jgi:peptidoglycan/LPS O-acetylase OafA/YrhL
MAGRILQLDGLRGVAIGLVLALLLACLHSNAGPLHAAFTFGPFRGLGTVSYFVFLFHPIALQVGHFAVFGSLPANDTPAGAGVTAAALLAVLLAAAASWRYLERPLLEEGRKTRY